LVSVLYIGERPELTFHDEESKRPKPTKTKGKPNMKRLMKRIIGTLTSTGSLASLLGLAMTIAITGTARADCGLHTLRGSYVFNPHGFNIVNGAAQPIAVFEGIDFNGDGTLTVPFATVSVNGLILHFPPGGTGTYTLNPSCEGTLTFNDSGVHYDIFVRGSARQIEMIETDANSVLNGTAEKVLGLPR
jgi:hypothetical protein